MIGQNEYHPKLSDEKLADEIARLKLRVDNAEKGGKDPATLHSARIDLGRLLFESSQRELEKTAASQPA